MFITIEKRLTYFENTIHILNFKGGGVWRIWTIRRQQTVKLHHFEEEMLIVILFRTRLSI